MQAEAGVPQSLLVRCCGPTVVEEEELRAQYFPMAGRGVEHLSMDHLASGHQQELQQVIPESMFWGEPEWTTLIK